MAAPEAPELYLCLDTALVADAPSDTDCVQSEAPRSARRHHKMRLEDLYSSIVSLYNDTRSEMNTGRVRRTWRRRQLQICFARTVAF